jgi:hypothetical protein
MKSGETLVQWNVHATFHAQPLLTRVHLHTTTHINTTTHITLNINININIHTSVNLHHSTRAHTHKHTHTHANAATPAVLWCPPAPPPPLEAVLLMMQERMRPHPPRASALAQGAQPSSVQHCRSRCAWFGQFSPALQEQVRVVWSDP